ncbi:MAG: protein kinase domain-containing protein [Bdellovibrio sp.]|jgi:serine/threonine protein kinase
MADMERFGKYLLLERLAAGGMAEVYLAKSIGANGINKFVAIKRILPQYSDNAEFIDMFKEEAKIAVNLNHSNIVSIYDFGIEKHQFFLVMEFVEGQNLRQILNHMKKEGKELALDQIIYLIKEVAAGLDHAHRCLDGNTGRPLNITHRDMSPQNVMLSFEGEIKIVDFGIAKAETQVENTRAGTIKGKFGYMSPEQADGHTVDPRTDIFSLGIVLWELLAKDRLFTGQNEAATLRKVRECQIPSLRKANSAISPELERICMKALAKDKSLRYQTAAAFHKDLNRFLNTQYPEFSTQEFSKYMKSLYHKMYLENRRKLADYAKISHTPPAQTSEDRTVVTATVTETSSSEPPAMGYGSPNQVEPEQRLNIDVQSSGSNRVDLSSLKSGDKAKPRQFRQGTMTGTIPGTQTGIRNPNGTQSRIYVPQKQPSNNNTLIAGLALVIALGGGYFYWKKMGNAPQVDPNQISQEGALNNRTAQQKPTPAGQYEAASKQIVPLNIQSNPQGAVVYVNGKNVGITPYIGHIESQKEFRLTLRKEGYLTYDRVGEQAGSDLYRLEATLQPEPPMGFVSIEVVGGGSEPVVTVNGLRLQDKSQLGRYPVPAGVPVKIRAINPFAQAAAEQTVTVGQSQKKAVRLILSRQGQSSP